MAEVNLRYAVLWHSGIAEPHFDLMVETYPGSELATWRSPVWPIEKPTELKRLKDHRRIYLEYEGALTGHRGQVERVAGGACQVNVGENSTWTLALLNHPVELTLRKVQDDRWNAELKR